MGWLANGHGSQPTSVNEGMMDKQLIDALLNERAGYVMRGLKDRVKQVDDSLRAAGYSSSAPVVETATAQPDVETASKPAPKKRTSR